MLLNVLPAQQRPTSPSVCLGFGHCPNFYVVSLGSVGLALMYLQFAAVDDDHGFTSGPLTFRQGNLHVFHGGPFFLNLTYYYFHTYS